MRPTDDPKEHNIRVRVNADMMHRLIKESERRNVSVSSLIRDLVDNGLSKNLEK